MRILTINCRSRNQSMSRLFIMQNSYIMPILQIRDMPQELYDNLKDSALTSKRSLTQEVIDLWEKALALKGNDSHQSKRKKLVEEISKMRKLSESEANLAKEWLRQDRNKR